jgi:hypothetical protein
LFIFLFSISAKILAMFEAQELFYFPLQSHCLSLPAGKFRENSEIRRGPPGRAPPQRRSKSCTSLPISPSTGHHFCCLFPAVPTQCAATHRRLLHGTRRRRAACPTHLPRSSACFPQPSRYPGPPATAFWPAKVWPSSMDPVVCH